MQILCNSLESSIFFSSKQDLVLQVAVLGEHEQLVLQLLTELQGDREQHEHLAQPRYRALRLVDVEARIAVRVLLETVVDRTDQLVRLNVERDRNVFRRQRRQRFIVETVLNVAQRALPRRDQRIAALQQRLHDAVDDGDHLVGALEVHLVLLLDVAQRRRLEDGESLHQMIGGVLNLNGRENWRLVNGKKLCASWSHEPDAVSTENCSAPGTSGSGSSVCAVSY